MSSKRAFIILAFLVLLAGMLEAYTTHHHDASRKVEEVRVEAVINWMQTPLVLLIGNADAILNVFLQTVIQIDQIINPRNISLRLPGYSSTDLSPPSY